MPERRNRLLLIVLKNREGALVQACNQVILVVDYRSVEYNFFDFFFEDEDSAIAGPLILTLLTRA